MNKLNIIEIKAIDAYENLKKEKDSVLLDVRMKNEFESEGCPDLRPINKELVKLTLIMPSGMENKDFISEFKNLNIDTNYNIYCICKSGVRSMKAGLILKSIGYKNLYNIIGGFSFGWKPEGLPSIKS
tara:strand:- start:224 stop:607 length:384 start_codon:yes stop_codon:yes gene_type:complete